MARAFLDTPRAVRTVVVAGRDLGEARAACCGLQRAAASLGMATCRASEGVETLDLEFGRDGATPVLLYALACSDAASLARPLPEVRIDLLLWVVDPSTRLSSCELYLAGMLAWSLSARQVRCILPTGVEQGAMPRWSAMAGEPEIELSRRAADWQDEGTQSMLGSLLEHALQHGARSARSQAGKLARRLARVGALAAICLGSLSVPAAASVLSVTIEGGDRAEFVDRQGALLWTGPYHTLRLQPGVGTWLEGDAGVQVACERESLHVALEGGEIPQGAGETRVSGRLELHSPEFTLVLRQGRLRVDGDEWVVTPQLGGPPLPGRQGLMVSGVLLVVILLLFFRAGRVRRDLDRPRTSLRHRRPAG